MKPYFKDARFENHKKTNYRKKKKILDYINEMFIKPANTFLQKSGKLI